MADPVRSIITDSSIREMNELNEYYVPTDGQTIDPGDERNLRLHEAACTQYRALISGKPLGQTGVTFSSAPNSTHAAMTCEDDIDPSTLKASLKFQTIPVGFEVDAITFLPSGDLLVAEPRGFKVHRYAALTSGGWFLAQTLGRRGAGLGEFEAKDPKFDEVQGIVYDPVYQIIYVVDQGNYRINRFQRNGRPLEPLSLVPLNAYRPASSKFDAPQGIQSDFNGNLFITFLGWNKILKIDLLGKPDLEFARGAESHPTFFNEPESMALGSGGRLFVANEKRRRIEVLDQKSGQRLGSIGDGVFQADVEGLQVRGKYLFAVDEGFDRSRVVLFDVSDPRRAQLIGSFGSYGSGAGQFRSPDGLAISSDGKRLAVADQGNKRVIVFDLEPLLQVIE